MSGERELRELLARRLAVAGAGAVWAVGWPPGGHPAPAAGLLAADAVDAAAAAAAAGGLAAISWRVDPAASEPELAAALAGFSERLAADGLLLVAVPVEGDQEPLPRADQAPLRAVVRVASEGGWSLRRDETAGGHRLLSLRPDPFLLRSYRDGDEGPILALFAACFPHARRGLDHWRWKYRDNPWGRHLISLAVDDGGELAAHYGGFLAPYSLRDSGGRRREVLGMQMADTMTLPTHRDVGRGRSALLPRTVRHFFARHRDDRLDFYYGFNTGPIQRFCEWFIGGFLVEPVGFWTRAADPATLPPPAVRLRVEEVTAPPGPAWDRFFRRVSDRYGSLVRRDAEYVAWRYLACPDGGFVVLAARRFGRLVGWGAFRRDGDRLLWGDALFAPGAAGSAPAALLRAALAHPRLAGAARIETWSPPRPAWWEAQLRELAFTPEPHPQGLGMVALTNRAGVATPDLLRGAYYTMGDSDLF